MPHTTIILFLFLLGTCVGSFLNVVVWRLPRDESLSDPPSHCPKCNRRLKWYDNIPILGWIKLGGKCRFCKAAISVRYPIVEATTALLFVFYYVMFFIVGDGPCIRPPFGATASASLQRHLDIAVDWPIFSLYLYLLSGLLAASLIDAELFIIPTSILWSWKGGVIWIALIAHAIVDRPSLPGALNVGPIGAAVAAGGAVGLALSILLLKTGKISQSFSDGASMLEIDRQMKAAPLAEPAPSGKKERAEAALLESNRPLAVAYEQPPREYSSKEVRTEMRKEMLFLLPPLAIALIWTVLTSRVAPLARGWESVVAHRWISGAFGSVLGALVGGFVVWLTRILGSLGFGREAMGMGDVDLMAGVGAVIGAGAATVSFFLAPFFGIVIAIYMLLTGTKRELPYGPYLSLATAFVMLAYCPIADYLTPGLLGLGDLIRQMMGS